jgi:colanic acid biosynthesis glycosyl transferase WcaI
MVVPAKLLTYGSAGRPVLVAGVPESEGAQFIARSGGGMVVEPQNARVFADAVLSLKRDPDRRARMARDIRSYVEKNFAREIVLADLEHLLEQAERRVAKVTARDRSESDGGRAQ